MLEERSVPCNATENTKHLLKVSVFARIISDPEWNILTIFAHVRRSPPCPASTDFKGDYTALWVMNFCPIDETLIVPRYFITISMVDIK